MTERGAPINQTWATVTTLTWWTIRDECRSPSVAVLMATGAAFLFGMRGCAHAAIVVNGATLDAATVVAHVSFHAIAAGALLVAALRAMGVFQREREDGTQAYLLARPIARWHYLAGKVTGLWVELAASMATLQGVLYLLTFWNTPAVLPGYLLASLLCSLNLLLVLVAVMACSLWLPELLAFLTVLAIAVVSFIGRGVEAAAPIVQSAMAPSGVPNTPGFSWWKVAWILWPKLGSLQVTAAALIGSSGLSVGALVPPLANALLYCGVFAGLCYVGFSRTEVI